MDAIAKTVAFVLLLAAIAGGVWWWQRGTKGRSTGLKSEESTLFGSTPEAIKAAKLILIDVNDKAEFDDAHIAGGKGVVSIYVPFGELDRATGLLPREAQIITYCSNYFCSACHTAAKKLIDAGFTKVKMFDAGIAAWYQRAQQEPAKYRFEGAAQRPYLKVHVNKPAGTGDRLPSIDAEELQKLIEAINILP
ncbi:MAG: rhodanese-like domain-containing protein [Candidatus Dependentiae bacterium]|nr:rhodanese-like domain-containing protein [Candidatus Dependentiae bacterium]